MLSLNPGARLPASGACLGSSRVLRCSQAMSACRLPGYVSCEEKIQLVANYAATVANYYAAVAELERGMVTGSRDTYARQQLLAGEARIASEAARQELDDHLLAHGC